MPAKARVSRKAADARKRDAAAIALIRESGLLNPSATLDDILKVSEKLRAGATTQGAVFIFTQFAFRDCPF
jgi:hypothetical protein